MFKASGTQLSPKPFKHAQPGSVMAAMLQSSCGMNRSDRKDSLAYNLLMSLDSSKCGINQMQSERQRGTQAQKQFESKTVLTSYAH